MSRSNRTADPIDEKARTWTRADAFALATVTALAALLRFVHLTDPPTTVGDEGFYARDACWYIHVSDDPCRVSTDVTAEHPPLGKWLIALGIRLFGYEAFGWRVSAAVAGTVTVALLYLLARRALRSTLGATFASGLLAIDFLHFVQSRVAMLDVFVTLFGVAAFFGWAYDQDRPAAARRPARHRSWWRTRPWLLVAGISAGAATASKWSGSFVWVGLLVLAFARPLLTERSDPDRTKLATLREEVPPIAAFLVAVPLIVYMLSFIGRVHGEVLALPWAQGSLARDWLGTQIKGMLFAHLDMQGVHPHASPAWSWPLLRRPMTYLFTRADGGFREIVALGSPLVWWSGLLALAYVAVRWARGGIPFTAGAVTVAGFAFTWGPWLLLTQQRSFVFIFYFLPAVPFLCLALGYVATQLGRTLSGTIALGCFALGSVGFFFFFYPVLTARPLSREAVVARMWFRDCEDTMTMFEWRREVDRLPARLEADPDANPGDLAPPAPPAGWCWM